MTKNRETGQIDAILEAVEESRLAHFPALDSELVREIVKAHIGKASADPESVREVAALVEAILAKGE